jgi:hypothetical protein
MAIAYRITDEQRRPQRRAKDFVARMGRIPEKVKRRINRANETSAEDLAAMMRRIVQKDDRDLERSITYYEVTRTSGGGITWRVTAGDETAFYARFHEFLPGGKAYFYPSIRAMRRLIRARQARAWRQGLKDADTP